MCFNTVACRQASLGGLQSSVSIIYPTLDHISPLPLSPSSNVSGSPPTFLPCSPISAASYSVDLKVGTRVQSLKANICRRIFRKSLRSFWRMMVKALQKPTPQPCLSTPSRWPCCRQWHLLVTRELLQSHASQCLLESFSHESLASTAASSNLQTARVPTRVTSSTYWPLLVRSSPSGLGERKLLLRAVMEKATIASLLQPAWLASPEQLRPQQ